MTGCRKEKEVGAFGSLRRVTKGLHDTATQSPVQPNGGKFTRRQNVPGRLRSVGFWAVECNEYLCLWWMVLWTAGERVVKGGSLAGALGIGILVDSSRASLSDCHLRHAVILSKLSRRNESFVCGGPSISTHSSCLAVCVVRARELRIYKAARPGACHSYPAHHGLSRPIAFCFGNNVSMEHENGFFSVP